MPTLTTQLQSDLKDALRAGDKLRLATLRLLLGEVKNREIEERRELEDTETVGLVHKAIKQRRDAAGQFRDGGRPELADREEAEITILEGYLPQQVGEDDLRRAIESFISDNDLSGPAAIGAVMQGLMPKFAGTADGGTLNRIAREILSRGE